MWQLGSIATAAADRMTVARERGEAKEGQRFASNAYTITTSANGKMQQVIYRVVKGKATMANMHEEMSEIAAQVWEQEQQDHNLVQLGAELQSFQQEVLKANPESKQFIKTEGELTRQAVLEAMSSLSVLKTVMDAAQGSTQVPDSVAKMAAYQLKYVDAFNGAARVATMMNDYLNKGKLSEKVEELINTMGSSIEAAYARNIRTKAEEQQRLALDLEEQEVKAKADLAPINIEELKARVEASTTEPTDTESKSNFSLDSNGSDEYIITDENGKRVEFEEVVKQFHEDCSATIERFKASGQYKDVMSSIERALNGELNGSFPFRNLSPHEISYFQSTLGLDLSEYEWRFSADKLRNDANHKKAKPNELMLTHEEIQLYPSFVDAAFEGQPTLTISDKNKRGVQVIIAKINNPATGMNITCELAPKKARPTRPSNLEEKKPRLNISSIRVFGSRNAGLPPASSLTAPSGKDSISSKLINVKDNLQKQEISSANTSINSDKVPAIHNAVTQYSGGWVKGTRNIDIGGGRYDTLTDALATEGVESFVYDPFNRSVEENDLVLSFLKARDGLGDTATCASVLNVIKEQSIRDNVIHQVSKAIKPEGVAYFTIYEGNGKGVAKMSDDDCWQNNRKTESYLREIRAFFGSVELKGKLIVARDPLHADKPARWFNNQGETHVDFSIVNEHAQEQAREIFSPLLESDARARALVRVIGTRMTQWNIIIGQLDKPEQAARVFGELNTLLAEAMRLLPASERFKIRAYQKLAAVLTNALESGKVRNFGQLKTEEFQKLKAEFAQALDELGVNDALADDSERITQAEQMVTEARGKLNNAKTQAAKALLEPQAELEHARQQYTQQSLARREGRAKVGVKELAQLEKNSDKKAQELEDIYNAAKTKQEAAKRKHKRHKEQARASKQAVSQLEEQSPKEAQVKKNEIVNTFLTELKRREEERKAELKQKKAERSQAKKEYSAIVKLYQAEYETAKEIQARAEANEAQGAKILVTETKTALDTVRAETKLETIKLNAEIEFLEQQINNARFEDEQQLKTCGLDEAEQIINTAKALQQELNAAREEASQKANNAHEWGKKSAQITKEAKQKISEHGRSAKQRYNNLKKKLLSEFDEAASAEQATLKDNYTQARDLVEQTKEQNRQQVEAAKRELTAARKLLDEAMGDTLQKADIQKLTSDIAEGKLFTLLQTILKDTRSHLETQIKKDMEERVFGIAAKMLPKKGKNGKLVKGKTNADDMRHLQLILAMTDATQEQVEDEQQRILGMIEKLDGDDKGQDALKSYTFGESRIETNRDGLEYIFNHWALFGDLQAKDLAQSTTAMKELLDFMHNSRATWQQKKEIEKKQIKTVANRIIKGVNKLRAKKGLAPVSSQTVKDTKTAFGRGMGLVTGQPSEFRNFAQTAGLLTSIPEVAPFFKGAIADIARANVELGKRENQDTAAIAQMVANALGVKTDRKGKKQISKWLNESKKNRATGATVHHKESKTINTTYADAKDWLLMSEDEAEAKRQQIEADAIAQEIDPHMLGYVAADEVQLLRATLRERITNRQSGVLVSNAMLLDYLDKRKDQGKLDITIELKGALEELRLSKEQAMYQILLWEQDRYKHNFELDGYTPETIEALYSYVGEEGLAIAYALRDYVHANGLELAEVYERQMGVPFPAEENYFVARFNHTDNGTSEDSIQNAGQTSNARYRSLIMRQNHNAKPDLTVGVFAATLASLAEQNNYICVSETTNKLRSLVSIPSARDAMLAHMGKANFDKLKQWLDVIDNAGTSDAQALTIVI